MKKILYYIFITTLTINSLTAHTNKTTLIPRSHGVNLALETTSGWFELIRHKGEKKIGGNFQAAFFYQDSTNQEQLGRFFGVSDITNQITFGINNPAANTSVIAQNVDAATFINIAAAALTTTGQVATLTLSPEQTAIGVYCNYHHKLDALLKGLYLRANLPIVNVTNDVHVAITPAPKAPAGAPTATQLTQYLSGNFQNANQAPLTNALLTSRDSKAGIADIDIILGYNFWNKESYQVSFNIGVTLPTGNKPNGQTMFQAIYGNGQHVGLGVGLDLGGRLWGDYDTNVTCHGQVNYRFLFQSSERRTLGVQGLPANVGLAFAQYALLGQQTTAPAPGVPLIPAANVLTQNVNVTPGNQIDTIVAIGYNNGGFGFDVGYNLFYRDADHVLRCDPFPDNVYAIPADTFNPAAGPFNNVAYNQGDAINNANLSTDAASAPSQTTHKVYISFFYFTKTWRIPLLIGAGTHYEMIAENSAIENWGVNVKAGVSF